MKKVVTFPSSPNTVAASFDSFIRPYMDHLFRLAYRFTGRKSEAEDLVQEVLIKTFKQWQDVAVMEKPKAWLSRVTHFTYVDFCRRYERSPLSKSQSYVEQENDETGSILGTVLVSPTDTLSDVNNDQNGAFVEKALLQLNPAGRALVVLHDIEGYTLNELVEMLDSPLGTLKSRLHRARRQLREILNISIRQSNLVEPFSTINRYY